MSHYEPDVSFALLRARNKREKTKMTESELLELGKRLERVERGVRRYRAALGIAGLLLAGGLLITARLFATGRARASTSAPAQIVARSFVLVDANGRTRAILGFDPLGPALRLYDKAGNMRAELGTGADGADLEFHDKAGGVQVQLTAIGTPDLATLIFYDEAERQRLLLYLNQGFAGVRLTNERGRALWRAP